MLLKAIGFIVVAFVAIFIVKMVLGAIFGFIFFAAWLSFGLRLLPVN